jgi:hypothetical protein
VAKGDNEMHKALKAGLAAAAFLLVANTGKAATITAVENTPVGSGAVSIKWVNPIQTFYLNFPLSNVEIGGYIFNGQDDNRALEFEVSLLSGGLGGAELASGLISLPDGFEEGWALTAIPSAGRLLPGWYALEFSTVMSGVLLSKGGSVLVDYPGTGYVGSTNEVIPYDWGIRVDGVVPIPEALPLLLSALGFFGFMGWRRKRMTAA